MPFVACAHPSLVAGGSESFVWHKYCTAPCQAVYAHRHGAGVVWYTQGTKLLVHNSNGRFRLLAEYFGIWDVSVRGTMVCCHRCLFFCVASTDVP